MAAKVEIIVTAKDAASQVLRGVTSSFGQLGNIVQGMTGGAGLEMLTAAVIDFGKQAVAAARDGEIQLAKVSSVIDATGHAAGLTAEQISSMSVELSRQSGIDDDLIMSASGVLLTFRQIGGEVFPEAMKAAQDMSAVMGQSLQSSVTQLGKALNDPIAGISALARVGVTFSAEQKAQIENFVKTNQLAKAQGVILAELNSEFGGAAKAMSEAGDGGDKLANAYGRMQGEIGTALLPSVRSLNAYLTSSAEGWEQYFIWLNKTTEASKRQEQITSTVNERLMAQGMVIDELGAQALGLTQATDDQVRAMTEQVTKEMEAAAAQKETEMATRNKTAALVTDEEAIKAATAANQLFLQTIQTISSEEQNYTQQISTLNSERAKTQAELTTAISQGWWEGSEKIQGYREKLVELNQKETEITGAYQQNAAQRILAITQQKLAVDGLTDAETKYLLDAGKKMGVYTQEQVDATKKQLDQAQSLADGFQQQQEQISQAEGEKFMVSSQAWQLYSESINTQLDTNIQSINEYINSLTGIPDQINTTVTVATVPAQDIGIPTRSSSGGQVVNYYIQNAYIDPGNGVQIV